MTESQGFLKEKVARAALDYIKRSDMVIGLGSGSTMNCFIEQLASIPYKPRGVVAASSETERLLKRYHIPVVDLNAIDQLPFYIDSADEVNAHLQLIKGRGGALTREKIIAAVSKCFICIVDESKFVQVLGRKAPLPIEVIPMGRSYVARELIKLRGKPVYREGFTTDNGNIILDTYSLDYENPISLECLLNNIPGVVDSGLFARRPANKLLLASSGCKAIKLIEN